MLCIIDGCKRIGNRARGLCHTCWNREMYGDCIYECRTPASSKSGICPNCKKRGGKPPEIRLVGYEVNTESHRYCSSCKTLKERSDFHPKTGRCKICQTKRKANHNRKKRKKIIEWLRINVLQTSLWCCSKCWKTLNDPHLDHILPVSLGGLSTLSNFQLLCAECNQTKGNRDSTDYRIFTQPVNLLDFQDEV